MNTNKERGNVKIIDKTNKILLAICITASALFIAMIVVAKLGILIPQQYKETKCNSVKELKNQINYNIYIPSFIENSANSITHISNDLVYIQCDNTAYKAVNNADTDIEPLGINIDYSYKFESDTLDSNNNIKHIKIMYGTEDNSDYTILDWYTDSYAAGVIASGTVDINTAISWVELTYNNIITKS